MKKLFSPKQVARAIDVSESSIKRWCDNQLIRTQHTVGGHRRIAMADLIEFIRSGDYELVNPEALGLPPTSGQRFRVIEKACTEITGALLQGDESRCRQIAVDLFLAEHSISVICDDLFAAAFRKIGEQWACGDAEIYQERRACEITLRVIHELRSLLPIPPVDAPLALGGAVSGDQYTLGTTMAEVVLRDAKWNSVSLGDNLPFATLAAAIREHRPKLLWLSCSFIVDEAEFLANYRELYDEFCFDVAFVVGGFALTNEEIRRHMKYSVYCDNMQHLEGFAQTLLTAIRNND